MQPQTLLRVVAQRHVNGADIVHWQVICYANADPADLDAWRKRKAWQERSFQVQEESNKRAASEMSLQTPLTQAKKVKESLKSPSYSTSAHA